MSTREKKIYDAAQELTGGGPPGGSARAELDGARAKTQRLITAAGDKITETVSQNSEKTLRAIRQGGGE
ncbi:MAG: hypothetical protein JSW50_12265 [Candidatus Latescibacterota bacterium]|nr:MAG: hypothetical protein JSW50_12265 [Candidatus Latescibacterota bacterium]